MGETKKEVQHRNSYTYLSKEMIIGKYVHINEEKL